MEACDVPIILGFVLCRNLSPPGATWLKIQTSCSGFYQTKVKTLPQNRRISDCGANDSKIALIFGDKTRLKLADSLSSNITIEHKQTFNPGASRHAR